MFQIFYCLLFFRNSHFTFKVMILKDRRYCCAIFSVANIPFLIRPPQVWKEGSPDPAHEDPQQRSEGRGKTGREWQEQQKPAEQQEQQEQHPDLKKHSAAKTVPALAPTLVYWYVCDSPFEGRMCVPDNRFITTGCKWLFMRPICICVR